MKTEHITAYALGELHGSEREEFEEELAGSPELQSELASLLALCEALSANPTDHLGEPRQTKLLADCYANIVTASGRRKNFRKIAIISSLTALAACLLIVPRLSLPTRHGPSPQESSPGEAHRKTVTADKTDTPPTQIPLTPEIAVSTKPAEPASPGPSPQPSAPSASAIATGNTTEAKLLAEGDTFLSSGRFDLATKRFEQVLAANGDNPAARRGLETTNAEKKKYADQVYNETRSQLLAQVDTAWERPVRRFQSGVSAGIGGSNVSGNADGAVFGSAVGGASISGETNVANGRGDRAASLKPAAVSAPAARGSASLASGDIPLTGRLFRMDDAQVVQKTKFNTEAYDAIRENAFLDAKANPLSTFSIDVDTASYANIRRFLNSDQLPPAGAVRIEELINYFPYNYPQPDPGVPFSVSIETARPPWAPEHELVRIGIKARELETKNRPASNLVFLVDVSGSMQPENKLPLLKRSLRALVENLGAEDRVAIAVYAGSSGMALPSTPGTDKKRILAALDRLVAGGSTNGAQGIKVAYETARENFLEEGNNRVILCTDGDFNVGVTSQSSLVKLIEKERASGVFLSVLGFGCGNLKDSTMEKLADKGNGNYAYIDSVNEGRKVLVEEMGGTLFTIAKDVKIQIEFNPARVAGYRLIGYEKRLLAKEDFNNDKKDAGEIGAGHSVTALYEVVPAGKSLPGENSVDPLKYQTPPPQEAGESDDLLTLKLRYKAPDGDTSKLIESPLKATDPKDFDQATPDFQFAAAVAAFGMKLRNTPGSDDIAWKDIQSAAKRSLGEDPGSYRAEFLTLVEKAKRLTGSR